jgi:hypothetical protein
MSQFYAQMADEDWCRNSVIASQHITINGLTADGKLRAFSGTVRSVESGQKLYPGYPLRITMVDAK